MSRTGDGTRGNVTDVRRPSLIGSVVRKNVRGQTDGTQKEPENSPAGAAEGDYSACATRNPAQYGFFGALPAPQPRRVATGWTRTMNLVSRKPHAN